MHLLRSRRLPPVNSTLGILKTAGAIDKIAERLREAGADVRRISGAPWIEDLELRLGFRLPKMYRALVTHYTFSAVDVGPVALFGNQGDAGEEDLASRLFRDPFMSVWLAERRLVQIGNPSTGSYDPVCLDLGASGVCEPEVVQLDHEDILQERRKVRRDVIAQSITALLEHRQDA